MAACTSSASPGPDGGGGPMVDGGGAMVDGGGSGGMVSFSSDVIPILRICTSCHYAGGGYAGLDLSPNDAYKNLVGVQSTEGCGLRVDKGNASKSYLYNKLTGQNICYGRQMPLGPPLTASQIKTVGDWINQGALNN